MDSWKKIIETSQSWSWENIQKEKFETSWNVWKYWKKYEWFSLPVDYLEWENFNDALSLTIDWSVYVLKKDWLISQYYSWKAVNFNYKWVSDIIKDA